MKNILRAILTILALFLILCAVACNKNENDELNEPIEMNLNKEYRLAQNLPQGEGKRVKVILFLGQSNASGSSIVSYLEKNSKPEDYARYSQGYPSVLINYCIDDHNACSEGEYVPVDLTCGATTGFFGPEVGMADELSRAYPDETIMILKYTMSGFSLHQHWLARGERGSIYDAFIIFAKENMEHLRSLGYDAEIGAICWMQGESDTTEHKASHYFENQKSLVSYLREDLSPYSAEGGIYFIDAGISNSPYCEPAYSVVNEAKRRFSELSRLNIYFPTIEAGLTTMYEPDYEPDLGHYDALCELELGRLFAKHVIESYLEREILI